MRRLGSGDAPDHMPSADAAAGTSATCYQFHAMPGDAHATSNAEPRQLRPLGAKSRSNARTVALFPDEFRYPREQGLPAPISVYSLMELTMAIRAEGRRVRHHVRAARGQLPDVMDLQVRRAILPCER